MIQQRSFPLYLLLNFVTCGIYGIFFWYEFSNDMNVICNGDGKETPNYIVAILLSFITCGIYYYYYFYCIGNRQQENAPRYGLNLSENGTTYLVWGVFGVLLCGVGPFIATYIQIKNMNLLAERYNSGFENQRYNNGYNNGYTNTGYNNNGYNSNGYSNNGYSNNGYTNNGHTNNGYNYNEYNNNEYNNNGNSNEYNNNMNNQNGYNNQGKDNFN